MGRRDLDIELMYASNLTRQYHGYYGDRMAVHAQAYITNDSMPVQCTFTDYAGDVNPRWGHPLRFSLNCSFGGNPPPEHLNIDLFSTTPCGSFWVGSVQIPLVRFLSGAGEGTTGPFTFFGPVNTGGVLHFSYRLGPHINRVANFAGAFGGILLESALESGFSFGLDNLFGN